MQKAIPGTPAGLQGSEREDGKEPVKGPNALIYHVHDQSSNASRYIQFDFTFVKMLETTWNMCSDLSTVGMALSQRTQSSCIGTCVFALVK